MRINIVWCCGIGFGETKVSKSHMTIKVNENIFWFEVTVDDAIVVKVLHGED